VLGVQPQTQLPNIAPFPHRCFPIGVCDWEVVSHFLPFFATQVPNRDTPPPNPPPPNRDDIGKLCHACKVKQGPFGSPERLGDSARCFGLPDE